MGSLGRMQGDTAGQRRLCQERTHWAEDNLDEHSSQLSQPFSLFPPNSQKRFFLAPGLVATTTGERSLLGTHLPVRKLKPSEWFEWRKLCWQEAVTPSVSSPSSASGIRPRWPNTVPSRLPCVTWASAGPALGRDLKICLAPSSL